MIDFVEELLLAWGAESISPSIEVSIPSPLGRVDEGDAGMGGHHCLSLTEQYVASDQHVLAAEQALRDISDELAGPGRELVQLAQVRYASSPALPLAEQYRVLNLSRNTYRARVDRLHVEVAARYPGLVAMLEQAAKGTQAAKARACWMDQVRKAARKAERVKQAAAARRADAA